MKDYALLTRNKFRAAKQSFIMCVQYITNTAACVFLLSSSRCPRTMFRISKEYFKFPNKMAAIKTTVFFGDGLYIIRKDQTVNKTIKKQMNSNSFAPLWTSPRRGVEGYIRRTIPSVKGFFTVFYIFLFSVSDLTPNSPNAAQDDTIYNSL